MKYKRVIITRHGGPEVLQVIEEDLPEPQTGEVRVKILATSAAFTDVLVREGLYPGIPPVPFSPGYDIVGSILQLGKLANSEMYGTASKGKHEFVSKPRCNTNGLQKRYF